jgi:hypothetical protein
MKTEDVSSVSAEEFERRMQHVRRAMDPCLQLMQNVRRAEVELVSPFTLVATLYEGDPQFCYPDEWTQVDVRVELEVPPLLRYNQEATVWISKLFFSVLSKITHQQSIPIDITLRNSFLSTFPGAVKCNVTDISIRCTPVGPRAQPGNSELPAAA